MKSWFKKTRTLLRPNKRDNSRLSYKNSDPY